MQRRAHGVFGKFHKGSVLASQLIILGQLVRQSRDVRQQMLHRDLIAMIPHKLWKEFLHRIIQFKFAAIKQGHQRRHVDRLGDRPQKKHGIFVLRFSKRSHERLLSLSDMQHRGRDLAFSRGPF